MMRFTPAQCLVTFEAIIVKEGLHSTTTELPVVRSPCRIALEDMSARGLVVASE
ncbi:hypothetical protein FIBSPDRAFT_857826 [Athelia psychrophila]|uniref:Uncharacterized protein n=1 Tax=Athelia psychrophila TaxID=1759441 RepID=A0A166MIJ7_9AGAM|nr:hypothetical protein FIBSPDRAFT_857826 [Fibularhizoctonia sp. CBS 109695]